MNFLTKQEKAVNKLDGIDNTPTKPTTSKSKELDKQATKEDKELDSTINQLLESLVTRKSRRPKGTNDTIDVPSAACSGMASLERQRPSGGVLGKYLSNL